MEMIHVFQGKKKKCLSYIIPCEDHLNACFRFIWSTSLGMEEAHYFPQRNIQEIWAFVGVHP